jgi:DNA-binding MarR family transcriptional regulator
VTNDLPDGDRDQVDEILAQWARERPELDTSPMGVIGRISRIAPLLVQGQARVFQQFGLDFASFDVLATLRRSGTPYELTPGALAHSMIVTPSAVTQRLARLEDLELVVRRHDNPDRRKVTVALTPRGRTLIDDALPAHLDNEHRMLAVFSQAELEIFASLLRRLQIAQNVAHRAV